ncbi:MAG: hypothetical protein KAT78_03760 [Flavobacteriaceae bacterium]|nr:hypothetical protein [Flavobacteriaceae bacterium]
MKRLLILLVILFTLSCDDGGLDIASFEFEETINHCGESTITLYRLSNNGHKEVLMLTLTDNEIREDEEVVAPVQVSEIGKYTVTDRVFKSEVTSSYFCATVPPVEPIVLKNWKGISGTILVQNEAVYETGNANVIAWKHTIILQDVVLKDGDKSLIFNDTYLFGVYETPVN